MGYIESIQGIEEEPLKLELQSIIHSVSTGAAPVVSGQDGLAALDLTLQVLEAIGTFTQRHESGNPSLAMSI